MSLKYNESTGEFVEKDEPRKQEPIMPRPFIYDDRDYTRIPPITEPPKKKTKGEDARLSIPLSLLFGILWLALPYLILLGFAALCS